MYTSQIPFHDFLSQEMKEHFQNLLGMKERHDYHPEDSALHHVVIVTNRCRSLSTLDAISKAKLIITALFHDIGKWETRKVNPNSGNWTSPGHEFYGAKCMRRNEGVVKGICDFLGVDADKSFIDDCDWLIANHMKIKQLAVMKPHKQLLLTENPLFDLLVTFNKADSMIKPFYDGENMWWKNG